MLRHAALIFMVFCLCACGFQLRGTENAIHHSFAKVSIINNTVDKGFQQVLEEALKNSGVAVTQDADATLEILSSNPRRRTASFSSRAKSAEFELFKEVSFRFSHQDDVLIEPTQLLARRSYLYRETAAVGKAEEENLLKKEMDEDLAQRILLSLQRAVAEQAQL